MARVGFALHVPVEAHEKILDHTEMMAREAYRKLYPDAGEPELQWLFESMPTTYPCEDGEDGEFTVPPHWVLMVEGQEGEAAPLDPA